MKNIIIASLILVFTSNSLFAQRLTNSSGTTIGYFQDNRVKNANGSTIDYVEDGGVKTSSGSTFGYFEEVRRIEAVLFFLLFLLGLPDY